MKKSRLTKKQIESAEKDAKHPVVQLMLNMQDYIEDFNKGYERINGYRGDYIIENLQPFAKELDKLDNFSMHPLDLISVWSAVYKKFYSLNRKDDLAIALSTSYAIKKILSKEWRGLSGVILKKRKLPDNLLKDKKNQLYFWKRIKNIKESLKEIGFYRFGTRKDIGKLYREQYLGFESANKKLNKIHAWEKEHDDNILSNLHEDFSEGLSELISNANQKIKRKILYV